MRRIVLALCISTLLAILAAAQQAPPNAPLAQAPGTIRVGTQLVVETVIVKDRNGNAIQGLTTSDFTLTEDGVPQTISFVEFQHLEDSGNGAPPAPPPSTPAVATAPPTTAGQISPGRVGDTRY